MNAIKDHLGLAVQRRGGITDDAHLPRGDAISGGGGHGYSIRGQSREGSSPLLLSRTGRGAVACAVNTNDSALRAARVRAVAYDATMATCPTES